MFERFSDGARRAVVLAQEQARRLNHNDIGAEHILLGLIQEGDGVAAKVLENLGISLDAVLARVEDIIGLGTQAPSGYIPFTPRAKNVLGRSLREALRLGHNYVGTGHILLALIREGDSVATQIVMKLGTDFDQITATVMEELDRRYERGQLVDGCASVSIRPYQRYFASDDATHRRFLAWATAPRPGTWKPVAPVEEAFTLRCVPCGSEYLAGTVLCPECMSRDIQPIDEA